MARALGGIDIGWLFGLIVSGGCYYLLSRSLDVAAEKGAIDAREESRRAVEPAS